MHKAGFCPSFLTQTVAGMWSFDVQIHSDVQRGNPLTTTGGHVWDAAKRLAEYFEAEADNLNLKRKGLKILELGAGCGWLGLVIAKNLPEATVCMTEMEYGGALEHLAYNVELNRSEDHPFQNVSVADCDWSHWGGSITDEPAQTAPISATDSDGAVDSVEPQQKAATVHRVVLETEWDLIVGSDLVYNEIGVQWLPKVLAGLLERGGVVYYCHTKHRMDMADQDFVANLAALGLACTEVREEGADAPPPSPPFFESLFPEQRIAIWRIHRSGEQQVDYTRELYNAPEPPAAAGPR